MNMDEKNPLEILNQVPLDTQTAEIANDILKETDVDKVKDLTNLFNLNQRKKNVVRLMKFNSLLDSISDHMLDRFEKRAGEFSNSDLLDYMQVVQSAIDRTQKSLDLIADTPAIQVNTQNNVNINLNDDGLSRESKKRVADAVAALLDKIKQSGDMNDIIETDATVIEPTKTDNVKSEP